MVARAAGLWKKLKSPPENDIGAQRWRKIFVSLGSTFSSRVLAQGCNLLMVPIALRYLGAERFGVWMTLTSSVSLLSFFDFGIGIGLQNRVAEMMGKERLDQLGFCMRSTLAVLVSISVFVFVAVTFFIFGTNIAFTIFQGTHFAAINLRDALVVIAAAFMLGLPLSLFPRIAFGLQQGWISSVAATCGTVLSLLAVLTASLLRVDFTSFVAFTVVPPIAAQAVGYFLLARRIPGGLPMLGPVSFGEGLETLKQGAHYVLPQVTGAVLMQGPMIFLGTQSSPFSAATYSILTRIGTPFQQLQQMFLAQIWPAITEAMHRGDTEWLKKTLRRISRANLLFGSFAATFVAFAVLWLFPLLTRDIALKPSWPVVVLYSVHVGIMCVVQGLSNIANGLCRMQLQNYLAALSVTFAATVLPFAAGGYGINGVLSAMLGLNCLLTIPFLYWEYVLYLRHTEQTSSTQ